MSELKDLFDYAYPVGSTEARHVEKIDILAEPQVTEYVYGYSITYQVLDSNKDPVPGTKPLQTINRESTPQATMWTDAEYISWVNTNRDVWVAADKLVLCGYVA